MELNAANKDHLADRKKLLSGFDDLQREMDHAGGLKGADAHTARAFDVLTSSKLVEALDLSKESAKVRDRYGDGKPYKFQYDGAPTVNEHLLMARRLVEAGARVVTLSYGRWDSHGKNFDLVRDHGAKLDQCLTALVEDLEVRGMLDDVTVIAWGEFGRTPQINKDAGRDHWPQVELRDPRRRRHEDRPGHRQHQPHSATTRRTARCSSARSSPRSTTTSASTPRRRPSPTRPAARSTSRKARRCRN